MKAYTKEALIKAQQQYNRDVIEHPENFSRENFNESVECATGQIEYLLEKADALEDQTGVLEVTFKSEGNE